MSKFKIMTARVQKNHLTMRQDEERCFHWTFMWPPVAVQLILGSLFIAYSEGRHPELLIPLSSKPPCQGRNLGLSDFIRGKSNQSGHNLVPHEAKDLDSFAVEIKEALDSHMLSQRAIDYVFSNSDFKPTCAGIWAEFGVASGGTVNLAAKFRRTHCSSSCPPVYGFDTFTGLPENWVRDDKNTWKTHAFDQQGFPPVEPNVHLVKGLFNESLPKFLSEQAIYAPSDEVVSFLHIDCDLYAGARDALTTLAPKLVVGTVIVFDDLVNYQYFKDHELKAMWEWVTATGTKLLPIGMLGPLPNKQHAVELDWAGTSDGAADWHRQSAAFVIAHQSHPWNQN